MSVKCKLVGVPGKTYAFPKNGASPKNNNNSKGFIIY